MLRQVTVERVMWVALVVVLVVIATSPPVDTDVWWHLQSGATTLDSGFIRTDLFSHTVNGQDWVNHSWGAQVVLYGAYVLMGDWGLWLYTVLLAVGGILLVYRASVGNIYLRAFVVTLAASVAVVFWSPRPQMFSFFFGALVVYWIYDMKAHDTNGFRFFPLLMLLWGNLHAGFAIGFILLGGFIAGEVMTRLFQPTDARALSWRTIGRLVLFGLIGAAILVVNPNTYRIYLIPFQTVGVQTLRDYIQEWQSPDFQRAQFLPFIVMLFALIGAIGASPKRLGGSVWVLIAGTGYMALVATRNMSLFAVVAAPPLAYHLHTVFLERGWRLRPMKRVSKFMGGVNVLLIVLIMLGGAARIVSVMLPEVVYAARAEVLPLEAVAFIQDENPQGNLFNSYNWGGYLVYTLPAYPVFVDGRTDMYGDEFLRDYLRAYLAQEEWVSIFERYDIGLVLVESNAPIGETLRADTSWYELYADDHAVVYQRADLR